MTDEYKKSLKVYTVVTVFFICFGLLFVVLSIMILFNEQRSVDASIMFFASITTTIAALLSLIFSSYVSPYKARMWSLFIAVFIGCISVICYWLEISIIKELMLHSKNGFLWGINLSLLLFNAANIEIKKNGEEIDKISNENQIYMNQSRAAKEQLLKNYEEQKIKNEKFKKQLEEKDEQIRILKEKEVK